MSEFPGPVHWRCDALGCRKEVSADHWDVEHSDEEEE